MPLAIFEVPMGGSPCYSESPFLIMAIQTRFSLRPRPKGFHLITEEVIQHLPALPENGVLHLFLQHTSAGLTLNENADPSVRKDFQLFFKHLTPEHLPGIIHIYEGPDDMPAHVASTLTGVSVMIPISRGKLNLGTWQGIYLCEFRQDGGARHLVATVLGG